MDKQLVEFKSVQVEQDIYIGESLGGIDKDTLIKVEDTGDLWFNGVNLSKQYDISEDKVIENIVKEGDELNIIFTNGDNQKIDLSDIRTYWEKPNIPDVSNGAFIVKTHPTDEFKLKGSASGSGIVGVAYFDGEKVEIPYRSSHTTIDLGEKKEHIILFVITNHFRSGFSLYGTDNKSIKHIDYITNYEFNEICEFNEIKGTDITFNILGKPKIIKRWSFENNSGLIGDLVIPDSVNIIEMDAFKDCSGLNSLTLQEGLKIIGSGAFRSCSGFISKLIIPESVTLIGARAFQDCRFTGELIIPEGLPKVGFDAFNGCTNLTKIYVCEDTELGSDWNKNCPAEVIKYKKGETPWLEK